MNERWIQWPCVWSWGLEWDRLFPLGGKRQASHTELQSVKDGTRQHCDAHHDQYAAERSQNKLLTIVSLWPELGPATTVARAGWVPECHPKSCGMLGNLNYRGTRDRTITLKRAVGELSVRLGVRTLTVVDGLFCSKWKERLLLSIATACSQSAVTLHCMIYSFYCWFQHDEKMNYNSKAPSLMLTLIIQEVRSTMRVTTADIIFSCAFWMSWYIWPNVEAHIHWAVGFK